jgi:hypothetical protein
MLGKLKDMASSGALDKAITHVEPIVREHLAKLQTLGADLVRDDVRYASLVIEPAYLAVVSASSGATKLIPQFKERFGRVMLALRDELVVIEGNAVRLVDDFQSRLPTVLANSLKQ